jgi:hypothetical protein
VFWFVFFVSKVVYCFLFAIVFLWEYLYCSAVIPYHALPSIREEAFTPYGSHVNIIVVVNTVSSVKVSCTCIHAYVRATSWAQDSVELHRLFFCVELIFLSFFWGESTSRRPGRLRLWETNPKAVLKP